MDGLLKQTKKKNAQNIAHSFWTKNGNSDYSETYPIFDHKLN